MLHVVNAWQHGSAITDRREGATEPGSLQDEIEAAVEAELALVVQREVGDVGVETTCRAVPGQPAHALSMEATRLDACLVVVGARGAGGALRRLLGSVSRELTECPTRTVAVVPEHEGDEPDDTSPIVVGVDGSDGAARAVRWTAAAARRASAEVVAVHALEPVVADVSADEQASLLEEARLRLETEWTAPLRRAEVAHRSVVATGHPAGALQQAAAAERPMCVVVGSRGVGVLSQALLGSVTHSLVRGLQCTVVIAPAPRDCVTWSVEL